MTLKKLWLNSEKKSVKINGWTRKKRNKRIMKKRKITKIKKMMNQKRMMFVMMNQMVQKFSF